ncbi:MAG: response regulator transcription factor [Bacteroidales bacterium]|jgi:two-component system LytT family response regulator|nr:response regulator transcription factor [Bacteroidales bacterium]
MKCIVIDDEPLALKQICAYVEKTPGLELITGYESSLEAREYLLSDKNEADLMFVDVNMPDLKGVDLVKSLIEPPIVIFTTAYSEYAVEGFKVGAVDYVLKPISYNDFKRAVEKAQEVFSRKTGEKTLQVRSSKYVPNGKFFFVKSEYKVVRINFDEIKYIESVREYVKFYLENRRPVMSLLTIKAVEGYLPENKFMRVHRSFIVNLDKINEIERLRIVFDGDTFIPVSEQYKDKFQEYLDKNFAV